MLRHCTLVALVALLSAPLAAAGTFATVTIDADFSDWAAVPVLASDPLDNPGGPDVADVQIANDNDYLYMRFTYHTLTTLSTFISLDSDNSLATGFDIFGLGAVGADANWQNDFPFTSSSGVFNNGFGMSGDFFGTGAALLAPYADAGDRELAIPLDITFNETGGPVFPTDTFTILLWTDQGDNGEVVPAIQYTLAVPEPAAGLLVLLGALPLFRRR